MMIKNKYARVVVGIPIDNIFDYLIPHSLLDRLKIGMRVVVPFGRRRVVGYVVGFTDKPEVTDIKELGDVLDEESLLLENFLKLTRWMGHYYFSSWGMAIKTALPSTLSHIDRKTSRRKRFKVSDNIRDNGFEITGQQAISFNKLQMNAIRAIKGALTDGGFKPFLLHGRNGKIEVYMNVIARLGGRGAIILVPEIYLTSELITRFRSRFGSVVAVLHSGLSEKEKLFEWRRIQKGEAEIAIGVRSAVFAPFKRLGLIVVDEEHDPSYKQEDALRYNVRDVALMRGKIEGITVVLCSSTPSLESFYNVQIGKYDYIPLHENTERKNSPSISLIDIGREKNRIISDKLGQGISERLKNGEKVLLLLNRRGYSPFLLCRDCGYTPRCPNCSITLNYHKAIYKEKDLKGTLLDCHYCNYKIEPRVTCPDCGGTNIGCIGIGTERVEEELKRLYPEAGLIRIDRDIISRGKSGYKISEKIREKDIDIFLGTQIIARMDSFPHVTLAGVIWVDGGLNIPDFRSGERAFQLINQLSEKIENGKMPGEVMIQTHNPDNYILRYAREKDYNGFYRYELGLRKELRYPPFYRLVRIVFRNKNESEIIKIIPVLKGIIERIGRNSSFNILGPAQAPIYKMKGDFRWHIIIKGKNPALLHDYASRLLEVIKEKRVPGIKLEIDVDPVRMV